MQFPNSEVRTRVLVDFIEITGGPQQCTRVQPYSMGKFDLARSYIGFAAIASIHVRFNMNYTGFAAAIGGMVRFSEELQWFWCHREI